MLSRDLGNRREHISTDSVSHDSSKISRTRSFKKKNVSEHELKPKRFNKIKSQLDFEQTNEAYYGIDGSSSTISFSNL